MVAAIGLSFAIAGVAGEAIARSDTMKKDDKMNDGEEAVAVRRCRVSVLLLLVAFVGVGGAAAAGQTLRLGAPAPDIAGQPWINSGPLTMQGLRGRVVLVEFWTYG